MSTYKTKIDFNDVRDFLIKKNATEVTIEKLEGGELSQAFRYQDLVGKKVIRINSLTNEGFLKDEYAFKNFSSPSFYLPIIEEVGEISENVYYSISEYVEGRELFYIDKETTIFLLPKIIKMVDDIHATRILETGYGWWNIDGKAKANSWREALDQVQIAEDDYKLDNISFFDQDFVNKVHVKIKTYYDLCPDNRYLIHADLIGNIMADNKQVTGVIDWHNSMYGDRIWDIAWFEFWDDKGINYPLLFKEFYKQQGVELENYNERLNCYYLIIGINSMSFFAKSSQQEKYKSAKDKTAQRFNK